MPFTDLVPTGKLCLSGTGAIINNSSAFASQRASLLTKVAQVNNFRHATAAAQPHMLKALTIKQPESMKYLISVLSLMFSMSVIAVDITTSEGIHIVADTVTADRRNGMVVYSGNVVVKQGGMEFKASEVNEYRKDKVLIKLVAHGKPTVFINKLAAEGQVSNGTAESVVYTAEAGTATLTNYKLTDTAGSTNSGGRGVYLIGK